MGWKKNHQLDIFQAIYRGYKLITPFITIVGAHLVSGWNDFITRFVHHSLVVNSNRDTQWNALNRSQVLLGEDGSIEWEEPISGIFGVFTGCQFGTRPSADLSP